jgi:hypothetical protein
MVNVQQRPDVYVAQPGDAVRDGGWSYSDFPNAEAPDVQERVAVWRCSGQHVPPFVGPSWFAILYEAVTMAANAACLAKTDPMALKRLHGALRRVASVATEWASDVERRMEGTSEAS